MWIAADLARDHVLANYADALAWALREAQAERIYLKQRRASWKQWQRLLPLHRKTWCLGEARALERMRSAGISAAEPRLAAVLLKACEGDAFLATRTYAGSDLERGLVRNELSGGWSTSLGALMAKLHAAALVHRDFFLRNVLDHAGELVLLDAHRSQRMSHGAWLHPRGRCYDLACIDLDLLALAPSAERNFFWAAYLARVPALPRRAVLERRVARAKHGLLRRFSTKSPAVRTRRAAQLGLSEAELWQRWTES